MQELKDKLAELLEENPDTPEAPKWKQVLLEIGMLCYLYQTLQTEAQSFFFFNHNLYQKTFIQQPYLVLDLL